MQYKTFSALSLITLSILVLLIIGNNIPKNNFSPSPTPSPIVLKSNQYYIQRVVDGDTVEILVDGKKQSVRLIGVDTPELLDKRKPVQCYAYEASEFAKSKLASRSAIFESDSTQGDRDKYGRLLRYIFIDGVNFNKLLIDEGYGFEYTYFTPYKYQKEFKESQKIVQKSKVGLWNPSVCPQTK